MVKQSKSAALYSTDEMILLIVCCIDDIAVNGVYDTKSMALSKLRDTIRNEAKHFQLFEVQHIPREENALADELANIALNNAR